jgi:hypothetical protein
MKDKDKVVGGLDIINLWQAGEVIVTLSKDAHKVDLRIHTARWVTDEFNISIEGSGSYQVVRNNYVKLIKEDAELLVDLFYRSFNHYGGLVLINNRIKLTYRQA